MFWLQSIGSNMHTKYFLLTVTKFHTEKYHMFWSLKKYPEFDCHSPKENYHSWNFPVDRPNSVLFPHILGSSFDNKFSIACKDKNNFLCAVLFKKYILYTVNMDNLKLKFSFASCIVIAKFHMHIGMEGGRGVDYRFCIILIEVSGLHLCRLKEKGPQWMWELGFFCMKIKGKGSPSLERNVRVCSKFV